MFRRAAPHRLRSESPTHFLGSWALRQIRDTLTVHRHSAPRAHTIDDVTVRSGCVILPSGPRPLWLPPGRTAAGRSATPGRADDSHRPICPITSTSPAHAPRRRSLSPEIRIRSPGDEDDGERAPTGASMSRGRCSAVDQTGLCHGRFRRALDRGRVSVRDDALAGEKIASAWARCVTRLFAYPARPRGHSTVGSY